MNDICQAAMLHLLRNREETLRIFLMLLSSCIHSSKHYATKNMWLTQINGFLDALYNTSPPRINLSDEVLSITFDKVEAMTNNHLVFTFINGVEFDYHC